MIRNALTTLLGVALRRLCDWLGLGVLSADAGADLSDTILEAVAAYQLPESEATP